MAAISCPVLIVQGDTDFTLIDHAGFMHDPVPGSALAVLPASTHTQVIRRGTILLPLLQEFLEGNGV